jgi:hypothetical protein
MIKKRRDALSANRHNQSRQEYVDYDYVKKLSKEERDYLAKFTDEFYGATWDINPVYMVLKDIPNEEGLRDLVSKNKRYSTNYGTMVQVYGNTVPGQINLDFRKIRHLEVFFEAKKDTLSTSITNKYSKKNVHNPLNDEHRLSCVENVRANRNDLMSKRKQDLMYVNEKSLEEHMDKLQSYGSPEDKMIMDVDIVLQQLLNDDEES